MMIRDILAKYFGYPLQDLYRRTDILATIGLLRTTQYWSDEKIRDYQTEKLKTLIKYAYSNVPYYEDLFHQIKLRPTDIRSINDISKIPILTKQTVRKENLRLLARSFNKYRVIKSKTGGTTGVLE